MSTRSQASFLAIVLAVVALSVGVRTGNRVLDTDEAVYQRTLRSMRAGHGYYSAMSDSLEVKEGSRPNSVRALRPPTLFLLLRLFPESTWRWLVGFVYLAVLLALARLGEPYGRWGALTATVAGGVWMIGASSYLYLHAELWGLPLFLAGLLAARREKDLKAAVLLAAATVFRELYGLALLIGLVSRRNRKAWLVVLAVVIVIAGVHVALAREALVSSGHQVALGNEPITLRSILRFLSPGDRETAFALGLGMLAIGFVGMARNLQDGAARILLPFAIFMIIAGIIATRAYWNLTYGPGVSAFIAAAFFPKRGQISS